MRFSVGLWDALFGKRTRLHVPQPDGTEHVLSVTQKWFDKQVSGGAISPSGDLVEVHHYDAYGGYARVFWKVGTDVPAESVERFRDPHTGALYAMTTHQDGGTQRMLLTRDKWEEWRAKFDEA